MVKPAAKPAAKPARKTGGKPSAKAMERAAEKAKKLTPQEEMFAIELAASGNQAEAYRKAYPGSSNWLPASLYSKASVLAAREKVSARVDELRAIAAKQNELGVAELLRMHVEIATADARELVEYRRIPCRHCHGKDHRYQFTPAEMERAREKHEEKQAEAKSPTPFDEKGGVGYTKKRAPHPDCPECHGDGLGEMLVSDTRKLSRVGAQLYEGVKLGKEGLEVKTRSRGDSLAAIGRHRGFFKEDNKVEVSVFDAETLEAKYRSGITQSMERQAAIVAARRKDREGR